MGCPVGPSVVNTFYHEQNCWDSCSLEYRPLYDWRYVDDIFVFFKSSNHLKRFQSHLNSSHVNGLYQLLSCHDISCDKTTCEYQKLTFSGAYIHFDSFLPDTYKVDMIYTLIHTCFRISFNWSMFHSQLILLREIFQKNGCLENFIDRCFELLLNRNHILKEKVPAVEKKPLRLVLPNLETLSMQTRTKLQSYIKGVLRCCKLHFIFKSLNKLFNHFCFKDPVPQNLTSL